MTVRVSANGPSAVWSTMISEIPLTDLAFTVLQKYKKLAKTLVNDITSGMCLTLTIKIRLIWFAVQKNPKKLLNEEI